MSTQIKDYHTTLGVLCDASADEIKKLPQARAAAPYGHDRTPMTERSIACGASSTYAKNSALDADPQ